MPEEIVLGGQSYSLTSAIIALANSDQVYTDIHVRQDRPVRIYTPRGWVAVNNEPVSRSQLEGFIERLDKQWKNRVVSSQEGSFDRPITLSQARLRCNVYRAGEKDELALAIRRLALQVPELDHLGLPASVTDEILRRGKGLVLVTGATGSGKTTTIAGFLEQINATRAGHIVTVEDPIEYVFAEKKCIISQRELGTNVDTCRNALRAALRQKPSVIMVGEIRDAETMATALSAAESGHLVFASLHTSGGENTVSRVLSYFEGGELQQKRDMLASVLISVISQVLVPSLDGSQFKLAYEVLMNAPTIAKAIQEGRFTGIRSAMQGLKGDAEANQCIMLNDVLYGYIQDKTIDLREGIYASYDPEGLRDLLRPGNRAATGGK